MARRAVGVATGRRSWLWAQGLACGLLVAMAPPLALVLAVLFTPALLAMLMAPAGAARNPCGLLLVYGVAAALPWLALLWAGAQSWPVSLDLLTRLHLPGAVWGAQAAAWLLGELVPVAARQVLEGRVRARRSQLREARSRLQLEWGLGEAE